MKNIILLILLGMYSFLYAQKPILSIHDIEQKESKTIRTFKKFQKKPNNKRVKERFIEQYNKSITKHLSRFNTLTEANQLEDKNWEGIINALKSLQYLNVLVKSSKATSFISVKDYNSKIDSISIVAAESLYKEGKKHLEKNENIHSPQIAYGYLKRVLQFDPDYLDTKELINLAISKGTKNIFFSPVKYDNLGNYIEWGSSNTSSSSDYIIKSLMNDLSVNIVGSHFVNNRINADWVVEIKWISINMSAERNNKYSEKRSATIKENGVEKTVHATVNYNERFKDVSGELNFKIKDMKTNNYIVTENFSGTTFFSKVEASYTGDARALTNQDQNIINNTNSFDFTFTPEGYELTTKMYSDAIHQQVLRNIGRLINWNY